MPITSAENRIGQHQHEQQAQEHLTERLRDGVDEPGEGVGGNDGARGETEQDARGERPQHSFGSRHEARR